MGTIVVAIDESEGAATALRWAVEEARLRSWSLLATMCWGYLDQHHGPGPSQDFDPAYGEAAAQHALAAIIDAAVGAAGSGIERRTVNDLAPRGLLESAANADMLVLGARGLGRFGALMLGSVSDRCLHLSTVPVAIVRATSSSTDERSRIVVGVDGSETAQLALRWAVDEACLRRATVEAVHAWAQPYMASPYVPDIAFYVRAAGQVLERAVESVDTSGLDQPVIRKLVLGSGGGALVDAAVGADLVVVGSRGLGGFKGLLLGSVSHQVSHHASCPVIVIPASAEASAEPRNDPGNGRPRE